MQRIPSLIISKLQRLHQKMSKSGAVLVVDYLLKVVLDLIIQLNHPKVIDNQRILVAELAEEVLDFDYASPNGKNIIMRISYFDALS